MLAHHSDSGPLSMATGSLSALLQPLLVYLYVISSWNPSNKKVSEMVQIFNICYLISYNMESNFYLFFSRDWSVMECPHTGTSGLGH